MITGRVTADRQIVIRLTIRGKSGKDRESKLFSTRDLMAGLAFRLRFLPSWGLNGVNEAAASWPMAVNLFLISMRAL